MYTFMPIYATIILEVQEVRSIGRDMREVGKKIWKERCNKITF